MKERYTYEDFLDIIATLRGEGGCPWDREQTHKSLRPCLMEEAVEVVAGIRILEETGNGDNLREELGDVLLQVVMHAQIAAEENLFTMEDVVDEVARKMVRRHPHVFGNVKADSSAQVLDNWDEIKKLEKKDQPAADMPLREIPPELPALTRAAKVLKKIDKIYDPMPDYARAVEELQKTVERLTEESPEGNNAALERLVGDALISISHISRLCKLPQEQILADRTEEMIRRYEG